MRTLNARIATDRDVANDATPPFRPAPHNIEAEQALLGAILVNNEAHDRVADFLHPEHFYDPLHQQIYETAAKLITSSTMATPITLRTFFEKSEPIHAGLTVPQYLGRLAANAATIINARDYGRTIHDLATRRQLILIGEGMVNMAFDSAVDDDPKQQIADAETRLFALAEDKWLCQRITATPYILPDPSTLPRRPRIYGLHEERKNINVTIAQPGIGKTTLVIGELLAKATGRKLLHDMPIKPLRQWLWNGEESRDELDLRIAAVASHYNITLAALEDRLHVDTGREQKLVIATMGRDGLEIARPVVRALIRTIREHGIDSVTIDPFVKSHAVPENGNADVDQVMGEWTHIADETNCAVNLVAHPRKTRGEAVTVEDWRGGSAQLGAVRAARALNRMTEEEASKAGVREGWRYIRVDDGKANNSPPENAQWVRLESIVLANGENVGVATPWDWPDPFAGVSTSHLAAVQAAIDVGRWRRDVQAPEWVGHAIAQVMVLDVENRAHRNRITEMLKAWIKSGALKVVVEPDDRRKMKHFVKVGARG